MLAGDEDLVGRGDESGNCVRRRLGLGDPRSRELSSGPEVKPVA